MKPRVLFYCQNLLGIGHLTRSLAISTELVREFEVHFIQGGPDVGKTLEHPDYHQHLLTPLLMKESDSSLYDPQGSRPVEEIFAERRSQISEIARERFDHCIVELYPFGRRKFRKEVFFLLDLLREKSPDLKVSCSLRDILVESQGSPERAKEVVQIVRERFDTVLVHSDPRFFLLDRTFPTVQEFADRIRYTGFVTEDCSKRELLPLPRRDRRVLVSLGGGSVGAELVTSVLAVVDRFPQLEFLFVPGPFSPPELIETLRASTQPNVRMTAFLNDFERELSRCVLSISLAGYNTVMNLLNTRTPGLVYPYRANQEQEMRAVKFMEDGLMRVLNPEDLAPEALTRAIGSALNAPYPEIAVDLKGAETTCRLVKEMLA